MFRIDGTPSTLQETDNVTGCVWTADGVRVLPLPAPPPGRVYSEVTPLGVSHDGSRIIGYLTLLGGGIVPVLWLGLDHQVFRLSDLLPPQSVVGWNIDSGGVFPTGISADGNTIVGYGWGPCGQSAWRARLGAFIPAAALCPGDFNTDTSTDPDDLADYIAAYFASPPDPRAEFDGLCGLTPDDLADFIAAYYSPCP